MYNDAKRGIVDLHWQCNDCLQNCEELSQPTSVSDDIQPITTSFSQMNVEQSTSGKNHISKW